MKRRAERQAETRQRIVEAAVDLHGSVGPSRTTFSMVAERAGVQRHTLYAHFPDERSLYLACSGLASERDPMPDADSWRDISNYGERLRAALVALYAWYERNAELLTLVLSDAEHDPLLQEIQAMRAGPAMAAYHEVLATALRPDQRALLELALTFFTWRTLAHNAGLASPAAAEAMARAIERAGA